MEECDDSFTVCCLYFDPMMISNLVFVGADDLVDCFKESHTRGHWDAML